MTREETAAERRARLKDEWDNDQKGGGANDGNTDKLKEGKNTRRILPKLDPEDPFWEAYAMHFNIGSDGTDSHKCIEPGGPFGGASKSDKQRDKKRGYRAKLCPSCKIFCKRKRVSLKFEFNSKEGKSYWRKNVVGWRAKRQYVFAVTRPKSKRPRKIYVHKCGVMIAQPLMEAYFDQDGGGDFTDPVTGRNVVLTKKSLSRTDPTNVEYKVTIQPDRTGIAGVDSWKKFKKKLPDLKSFIPDDLSPEAIQAIIDGDGTNDNESDAPSRSKRNRGRDDSDVESDDGEEREFKTRKRKSGKDEEVDPNAPEESDTDESKEARRKRRKAKKAKMRARLERRANRDKDL